MRVRFAFFAVRRGALLVFAPPRGCENEVKADYIRPALPAVLLVLLQHGPPADTTRIQQRGESGVGVRRDVKVDGLFWLGQPRGGTPTAKWTTVITSTEVTKEQQEALSFLIGKIYPVKWDIKTDTAPINRGDEGRWRGVREARGQGGGGSWSPLSEESSPSSRRQYWGVQKNDGFRLASRTGTRHGYDYKYEKQNGFTIIQSSGEEDMK